MELVDCTVAATTPPKVICEGSFCALNDFEESAETDLEIFTGKSRKDDDGDGGGGGGCDGGSGGGNGGFCDPIGSGGGEIVGSGGCTVSVINMSDD